MKKRRVRGHGLSLVLCGMLLFTSPLQTLAGSEDMLQDPVEETAVYSEENVEAADSAVATEDSEISENDKTVEETNSAAENKTDTSAGEQKEVAAASDLSAATADEGLAEENTDSASAVENKEASVPAAADESTAVSTDDSVTQSYAGLQNMEVVSADGVRVKVSFDAGTFGEEKLPELKVTDIDEEDALETAEKALPDQKIDGAKSVDISFYVDGAEVQPQDGKDVSVEITLPESVNPEGEQGTYSLIHEHDGAASVVEAADVSATEASFQTDSFSTFTITWSADGRARAILTMKYVDEDGNEIRKTGVNNRSLNGSDFTINFADSEYTYIRNDIDHYNYYRSYIKVGEERKTVTSVQVAREGSTRARIYRVTYLNGNEEVYSYTTNSLDGEIRDTVYMEYHSIHSGNQAASVFFLLTPTSNPNTNDTSHWNSNDIAIGLGTATVNIENATYTDNKNIFRERNNNGDLSQYIQSWPDGSTGATWTITNDNTNGQWNAIATDVASKYQAQLQKQLGRTTTVKAADISSIIVTPYKISFNNGNANHSNTTESATTETIHIDCTISVVCSKAYHYAFVVDYPEGSGHADGVVEEGDKAISVYENGTHVPNSITTNDRPSQTKVPQILTDSNGIRYQFDGWYTTPNYTGKNVTWSYSPTYEDTQATGTITFYAHYVPTTRNVHVAKTWNDNDDQDGIRPEDVTVRLMQGNTTVQSLKLSSGTNWEGTFTNVPVDGTFTVKEDAVSGYTSAVTGNMASGFTVTNTHKPETFDLTVTKHWNDNLNQDGKRPANILLTLHGSDGSARAETVTGDGVATDWTYTFTGLPKFANGQIITYTVTENQVENYSITSINNDDHIITNSYTPSKTSVTVRKAWDDNNDQDGHRPNDVTVKLLANGTDTGKRVYLSDANDWEAVFSNLDEYQNGQKIPYSVEEEAVAGYTADVSQDGNGTFTITNTHTPETLTYSGTKVWKDNHNENHKRPGSITVRLFANGTEVEDKIVRGDSTADTWSYAFESKLPKYLNGELVVYTVSEDAVRDYSAEIDGATITNKYTPDQTSLTVIKDWDDQDNQDGIRPKQVVVRLYKNGDKTDRTVTLNADNEWEATFDNLDIYRELSQEVTASDNADSADALDQEPDEPAENVYTVQEEEVPDGYEAVVTGSQTEGFKITNMHLPETITISGTKIWKDEGAAENRPESIVIRLLNGDNEEVNFTTATAENDWTWQFDNVPKKADGKEISYIVVEDPVKGYVSEITGSVEEGFTVTNTWKPDVTAFAVVKRWEDSDNQDGIRPESITISLLANGEKTGQTLILNQADHWMGSFENLPKTDEDGNPIVYTIAEEKVEGYESQISGDAESGFVVANSHNVKKDVPGSDGSDQSGQTPSTPGNPSKTSDAIIPPKQTLQNLVEAPASGAPVSARPQSAGTQAVAKAPQTGDTSDLARYGILLLAGLAALLGAVAGKLKKRS